MFLKFLNQKNKIKELENKINAKEKELQDLKSQLEELDKCKNEIYNSIIKGRLGELYALNSLLENDSNIKKELDINVILDLFYTPVKNNFEKYDIYIRYLDNNNNKKEIERYIEVKSRTNDFNSLYKDNIKFVNKNLDKIFINTSNFNKDKFEILIKEKNFEEIFLAWKFLTDSKNLNSESSEYQTMKNFKEKYLLFLIPNFEKEKHYISTKDKNFSDIKIINGNDIIEFENLLIEKFNFIKNK